MPVFNGEDHIAESIACILDQTLRDFELVIINDGSTDSTVEIIQSFKDPRIRLYHNENNLKIVKSLNKGLSFCVGKFIARMDCDDLCDRNRLQRQADYLDRHSDIGICGTFQTIFGGYRDAQNRAPTCHELIKAKLLFGPTMLHSTVMFRSDLARQYELSYDERFSYCEDYELWVRAARVTRLANIPEFLCQYRWERQKNWETDDLSLTEGLRAIWFRQLVEFGICPTEEEMRLHAALAGRGDPSTLDLWRAKRHLSKLIALNRLAGVQDEQALATEAQQAWLALWRRFVGKILKRRILSAILSLRRRSHT